MSKSLAEVLAVCALLSVLAGVVLTGVHTASSTVTVRAERAAAKYREVLSW